MSYALPVKSVEGVYRNGKVELLEPVAEAEGSPVVTWVHPAGSIDLRDRAIREAEVAICDAGSPRSSETGIAPR